ncbi:lysophospholipase L1-like esterase [Pseudoduganella lurida]|uniref:Lysophospholipase L1-like esterase n=1 Tax=Pseudoduganella lurida TaxID=1036180 RepID=A0A562R8N5_9BURK|nr:rhamnogalacturonan acetylesterase [Pseudoduganella lurida]TWI65448.1 lysophospholipase L1-like esterase [Pseudoduganella lurida]
MSNIPFLPRRAVAAAALAVLTSTLAHAAPMPADGWRFDFGAKAAAGYAAVKPDMAYDAARGFGLEPGSVPGASKPFYFTADVPEGNVAVTVTLGPGTHTIKAELRRLMLENVTVPAGKSVTRTFVVNTRNPQIAASNGIEAGLVKLKAPRETVQEAWNWDRKVTLEIHGGVDKVEIKPVKVPTIYLLGDSTVCDQSGEPYASWGQMFTRFFRPGTAVANHGESGETYRDSLARRRIDKIVSLLQPGDTVLLQFGHNDQKQIKAGNGGPFTTYQAEIRQHVDMIRARGALPVLVSPMERRGFDDKGKVIPSLIDYATAARQSAQELGTPFVDLNASSKVLYEALGEEASQAAFALPPSTGKLDNTHHNNYGAYELAKLVAVGLRHANVPAAAQLEDGFAFDPTKPDPAASFAIPASPNFTNERPLGDEANK